MKRLFAVAVLTFLLPNLSFADTLLFPSDNPVARITIPADWEPKETESGIDATSEDGAIYIAIDVANAKTTDKVIDDAIAFLQDNGVKIDGSTQKQSDEVINGMDMTNFDWTGVDEDGAVNVGLSLLSPRPGKLLVITYWGTKGKQEKHGAELQEIIASLKAAK
ncbi:histidine kinase [Agrobacterium vitis]|uniref:histidine kinase n=1 Tax=Allorhizobium ampelinum TaxID=3025782 RepID=UPI001F267B3D|nr:histidine kinase [Allorhizobium ampelinum]